MTKDVHDEKGIIFPRLKIYLTDEELDAVIAYLIHSEGDSSIPAKYRFVMNRTWKSLDDQRVRVKKDYSAYGLKGNPFSEYKTEGKRSGGGKG